MTYPKITKGLGKLTPELWIRLMDMLRNYERAAGRELRKPETENQYREYFLAQLNSCDLLDGEDNRWCYGYEEVEHTTNISTPFATRAAGQSGSLSSGTTAAGAAINLCEAENTDLVVGTGVYLDGADYPSGFNMMPIGMTSDNFVDGTDTYASLDVDVVVMMFNIRAVDGSLMQAFFAANSHDGTCTS